MCRRILRLRNAADVCSVQMPGWYFSSAWLVIAGKTSDTENILHRNARHLDRDEWKRSTKALMMKLIEQIMQKPMTEMQELYNNREIEK